MTKKQMYSKKVAQQKTAAQTDANLAQKILEGQRRAADFKQNWQSVDINGNNGHNYVDEHGKTHGRSHADYNQATHYRIKKPGE